MTAGLLYECTWNYNQWWSKQQYGYEMLLFIGIEEIHREDGVIVRNYRFHDVINNESVLFDESLALKCEEIKGDSHECD
jgi:hypothetical protein